MEIHISGEMTGQFVSVLDSSIVAVLIEYLCIYISYSETFLTLPLKSNVYFFPPLSCTKSIHFN